MAGRGAAWIDPCVLTVRLIAAGHTPEQAEACVERVPAWQAPAEGVDVFAAASVRLWAEVAENDPQPWKQDMAEAARAWAGSRLVVVPICTVARALLTRRSGYRGTTT